MTSAYFNPRPPWGGRQHYLLFFFLRYMISIHALRGEGDKVLLVFEDAQQRFQSTPSVGRATPVTMSIKLRHSISIHALRGEGDGDEEPYQVVFDISIHALRGEGDKAHEKDYNAVFDFNPRPPWGGRRKNLRLRQIKQRFQSTPSVGRATLVVGIIYGFIKISIHALRGEGD